MWISHASNYFNGYVYVSGNSLSGKNFENWFFRGILRSSFSPCYFRFDGSGKNIDIPKRKSVTVIILIHLEHAQIHTYTLIRLMNFDRGTGKWNRDERWKKKPSLFEQMMSVSLCNAMWWRTFFLISGIRTHQQMKLSERTSESKNANKSWSAKERGNHRLKSSWNEKQIEQLLIVTKHQKRREYYYKITVHVRTHTERAQ